MKFSPLILFLGTLAPFSMLLTWRRCSKGYKVIMENLRRKPSLWGKACVPWGEQSLSATIRQFLMFLVFQLRTALFNAVMDTVPLHLGDRK